MVRTGRPFFALCFTTIGGFNFDSVRRRPSLSKPHEAPFDDSMARRAGPAQEASFSRFLPGNLSFVSFSSRRHAGRVSFSGGESSRLKFGSRWDNGLDITFDGHSWPFWRRLALRSNKLGPGDFTGSRLGDPDVFSSSLWFRFLDAFDPACRDDLGIWF